jgi:2'-5' RNA ligase
LEPQEIIKKLREKIYNSLKDIALLDSRFESHVTLARVKAVRNKEEFIEKLRRLGVRKAEFGVTSFAFKKSTLTREGPIYEDIVKFNLS